MLFSLYLEQLGLTQKQSEIMISLFQYGPQAASSIATHCAIERTHAYKILLGLVHEGLVMLTRRAGTRIFFVESVDVIQDYLSQKQKRLQKLQDGFDEFANQIKQREDQRNPHLPKITLFEGEDGVKQLFSDIITQAKNQQLLSVKCFANNTLDAKSLSPKKLGQLVGTQIQALHDQGIHIENYLANGVLIMEQITKHIGPDTVNDLPAGHRAINIRVVGSLTYIIVYKTPPIGVKFASPELANALHVMMEAIG